MYDTKLPFRNILLIDTLDFLNCLSIVDNIFKIPEIW